VAADPASAPAYRHAAGKARAACHPGHPASTWIRADEAAITQGPHAIGRPDGGRRPEGRKARRGQGWPGER